MSTAGDHNLKSPLYVIGGEGKAIWTKELEVALKVGGVDVLDLEHIYVPTLVSNLDVLHWFYMVYTRFYLVLVSMVFRDHFRCFREISR